MNTKSSNLKGIERDLEIDVGLHVLAKHSAPGVPIPDRVIGEVCGRSHGWVCMMNRRLMRKIRKRLQPLIDSYEK